MNYYNEFDPNAAQWLRELIAVGLIPAGDVDERSISDVLPDDLRGYTQCHFFAGIGGWSLALRLAGWPEDRPVWTGSCPCQPFSTAGKRLGTGDERDLWPVFADLIRKCRPRRIFGEQVENSIGHGWLDRVYTDLEAEGYAVGAVVLGAHSVTAPHRRQRLYWGCELLADRNEKFLERRRDIGTGRRGELADGGGGIGMGNSPCDDEWRDSLPGTYGEGFEDRGSGGVGGVVHSESAGWEKMREYGVDFAKRIAGASAYRGIPYPEGDRRNEWRTESGGRSACPGCDVLLDDPESRGLEGYAGHERDRNEPGRNGAKAAGSVAARGVSGLSPWSESGFIYCRDKKIRRIPAESLLFSVADGVPGGMDGSGACGISENGGFPLTTQKEGRAMLLKGYGNAIVPQVAAEFVSAFIRIEK